jgi:hypothetical protein
MKKPCPNMRGHPHSSLEDEAAALTSLKLASGPKWSDWNDEKLEV